MRVEIAKSSHYRDLLFGVEVNIITIITSQAEQSLSISPVYADVDVLQFSFGLYDVLIERTTSARLDKIELSQGSGLEFWRILVQDFGTASSDAQASRLQTFMEPARANTIQELAVSLDRWKTIGAELGRPIDDDFKLIGLKRLVPAKPAKLLSTQEK